MSLSPLAIQGQEVAPPDLANPLSWVVKERPINWEKGILLTVLGLVGAMVTTFGLIGGAVPGTAGQAKIDLDTQRLERWSERLETLVQETPPSPEAIRAVEQSVNNLRDDLGAERWRQFAIASFLYLFLGATFAAIFASDLLQALLIGAGWTGIAGSLGLKRDYAERKAVKDEAIRENLQKATNDKTVEDLRIALSM